VTPEGRVKQQIKAYLRSIGARQFWPVQMGMGSPALDCICCINGCYYEVEVKRPGVTEATPRQQAIMRKVRAANGISFVTSSLEHFKSVVET
jgi:hypothetical protein